MIKGLFRETFYLLKLINGLRLLVDNPRILESYEFHQAALLLIERTKGMLMSFQLRLTKFVQ